MMKHLAELEAKDTYTLSGDWNAVLNSFAPDITFTVLVNDHNSDGRWNSRHDLVFVDNSTGTKYHTQYERGLTESVLYRPFEFDTEVQCNEVEIHEEIQTITVLKWNYI